MKGEILQVLYTKGSCTLRELSRLTNKNLSGLAKTLNRLKKQKLIEVLEKKITEQGRPARIYALTGKGVDVTLKIMVRNWLKEKGLITKLETKIGKYRIDVLGEDEKEKIGVEIKGKSVDWNFLKYMKYVNRLYLAVPSSLVSSTLIKKCKKNELGLLVINEEVREILKSSYFKTERKMKIKKEEIKRDFITNIELKILKSFFPSVKTYTTKQIEIKSRYSHERVYTTLLKLTRQNYLIRKRVGKTHTFKLNFAKDLILPFLYFQIERSKKFFNSLTITEKKMLKEFVKKISSPDLISVIVFGSYAKGEQREDSDIDILCIVRKGYDIEKIALSLKHKYGKHISTVIITLKDFPNIEKENPTFFIDLKEFGVILYGRETFYNLIYGGGYG